MEPQYLYIVFFEKVEQSTSYTLSCVAGISNEHLLTNNHNCYEGWF